MTSTSASPQQILKTRLKQARQLLFCDRAAKRLYPLTAYLRPQTIAGYIGFLGHQNLGDEILFEAFQKLFEDWQLLTYDGAIESVHNPPFCYYPLELRLYQQWVQPSPFYQLVFLGGGTLINRRQYLSRFQHVLQQQIPGVVFGTGVADPAFLQSKGDTEQFQQQIRQWVPLLKDAAMVTVRGPRSAQILADHGLSAPEVVGDPALAVCAQRPVPHSRTGVIGINVGSHGTLWGDQAQVEAAAAELIGQLIAMGRQVELLPFDPGDLKLSQRLLQQFEAAPDQVSIWPHFTRPKATLKRIHHYDLVIGQRLHACVLACGCGVPFIALKYEPKCDDFLDSVGMQAYSLPTDALQVEMLLSLVRQIEQDYDAHCQRLIAVSQHYQARLQQAAVTVRSLVSCA